MSEIGQRPPPYKAEFESSELKHRAESELLVKLGAKEEEVNIAVYRYMNFLQSDRAGVLFHGFNISVHE